MFGLFEKKEPEELFEYRVIPKVGFDRSKMEKKIKSLKLDGDIEEEFISEIFDDDDYFYVGLTESQFNTLDKSDMFIITPY